MNNLRFSHEWLFAGDGDPLFQNTSAQFSIHIDDICLTRSEEVWSKTVRDTVLVSTYPLAMWFASSWWRLNWEPLPNPKVRPLLDWSMAHEMGSANHGFVWPRILFASDGEAMNVWAEAVNVRGQSVNYLCGLHGVKIVTIENFQRNVDNLIETVLTRLAATGFPNSDMALLWELVLEDRSNPSVSCIRRLEAQMGFDPDECSREVITQALNLQYQVGDLAMSELAPIYGRRAKGVALSEITELEVADGILGKPQITTADIGIVQTRAAPWQQGVEAATLLRSHIGNLGNPIENETLLSLLGLTQRQFDEVSSGAKHAAAVATPSGNSHLKFIPRRKHPNAKRFEFSRFLGDHLRELSGGTHWLVSTDLATARQKYQRAFAAEFLCPIRSLVEFLEDDFTDSAFEVAGDYFGVSEQTVESLLTNNGYLDVPLYGVEIPYRLAG